MGGAFWFCDANDWLTQSSKFLYFDHCLPNLRPLSGSDFTIHRSTVHLPRAQSHLILFRLAYISSGWHECRKMWSFLNSLFPQFSSSQTLFLHFPFSLHAFYVSCALCAPCILRMLYGPPLWPLFWLTVGSAFRVYRRLCNLCPGQSSATTPSQYFHHPLVCVVYNETDCNIFSLYNINIRKVSRATPAPDICVGYRTSSVNNQRAPAHHCSQILLIASHHSPWLTLSTSGVATL